VLICLNCYAIFSEPTLYNNGELEYFGFPCRETYLGCPECGGEYATAHECSECSDYIKTDYIITANGNRICDNCYKTCSVGDEE